MQYFTSKVILLCLCLYTYGNLSYTPVQAPLSCYDLTAMTCPAGLSQCCIVGGSCCPDGSCCGFNQECLLSGGSYVCCTNNYDCPASATPTATVGPGGFHPDIVCNPVEDDEDTWYCAYGQSCGTSEGVCIGVALGSGGDAASSTVAAASTTLFDDFSSGAASSTFIDGSSSVTAAPGVATATTTGVDGTSTFTQALPSATAKSGGKKSAMEDLQRVMGVVFLATLVMWLF